MTCSWHVYIIDKLISCWQGGNGIEKDGNEPLVMERKFQRHPKPKKWLESPKEDSFRQQPIGSSEGCVSLLKLRLDGNLHSLD